MDPITMMAISGGSSMLSNLFNAGAGLFSAKMQFENQKKLQQHAYDLTQRGYRETPTNQRAGLEAAGYNPILAVSNGVNFGTGMTPGSASAPDMGKSSLIDDMSTAYQTFKLNSKQVESQVALNEATKDNQTAQASLNQQNAISEQIKQDGYRLDNNIKSIDAEMKNFDKNTQEYRFLQDVKEQLSRIKLNNVSADASLINAHANQINASANVTNARASAKLSDANTSKVNAEVAGLEADADWVRRHPKQAEFLAGAQRWLAPVGQVFGASSSFNFSKSNSTSKSTSKSYNVNRSKSQSHSVVHSYRH